MIVNLKTVAQTILTNWKTSGVTALTAILILLNLILPKTFTPDVNVKVVGALVALIGLFAKDGNVTGGTIINSPNDASVVKEAGKVDLPK